MGAVAAEVDARGSGADPKGALTRVLIADDTPAMRHLLTRLLEASRLFQVVAEAGDGRRAIELAGEHQPDLVVLDLAMPVMGGLEAIGEIVACSPRSRIVVLSGLEAERMGPLALEKGAAAYIRKGSSPRQLVRKIVEAARVSEDASDDDPVELLRRTREALAATERQLQVLTAELERSNGDLVRSNQDLQDFTAVAAHDLKSPLQAVVGFADLLTRLDDVELGDSGQQCLDAIIDGAHRMDALIEDLLAYSRVDSATAVQDCVDLRAAAARAVEVLQPEIARRDAHVTIEPLPTIVGDGSQFERLLQNLLSNALKFVAPDTTPRIAVGVERTADGWIVSVDDNGIGIEPDARNKVFRMFERLHGEDRYRGTGIGLAICTRIVERRGGRIWVEANAAGGSRFRFTVPDAPVADDAASPPERPAAERPPLVLEILLVEADDDASQVASLLASAAIVHAVPSLGAAVAALEERAFDCVLVDLSVGDARGLAALVQIMAAAPRLPIVVMTPPGDEALGVAATREGAQEHLTKGRFDGDRLARSIRYAIKRKALDAELADDAFHDPLTQLPNEALLLDRLDLALARCRRQTTSVAVLCLALDGFQTVNERLGYQAGDRALVAMAERLSEALRPQDTVARTHGDHFVVVCEGFDDPDVQIARVRGRLVEAIGHPVALQSHAIQLTASTGCAVSNGSDGDARSVLAAAEEDLRQARAAGRQASKR